MEYLGSFLVSCVAGLGVVVSPDLSGGVAEHVHVEVPDALVKSPDVFAVVISNFLIRAISDAPLLLSLLVCNLII